MEVERMYVVGKAVNQFIGRFQDRLGIERSRRLAKFYNGIRYRRPQHRAIDAYRERFDELFLGNDPSFVGKPRNAITEGWAVDRSGDFPYLEETLREADRMIEDRGGEDRRGSALAQTDYLFHLNEVSDLFDYPGLLDFPTSSEVLATVSQYMGMIPVFSQTRPKGVRVFESTDRYNEDSGFNNSQLYHRDIHDMPLVYAIVLVRDVSEENGPWCFLPAEASQRASQALNYQARGEPYRVTDERMYGVVDPSERIVFTGKRGDVLFIDSSLCFHYGSRKAVKPGYRLMYAFTTHCRSDFTRMMLPPFEYPVREGDSALRKMVLGMDA
jgi:hypothetical protein